MTVDQRYRKVLLKWVDLRVKKNRTLFQRIHLYLLEVQLDYWLWRQKRKWDKA